MSRIYVGDKPVKAVMIGGKKYAAKINVKNPYLVYKLKNTTFENPRYIDTGVDLSQYTNGYTVLFDASFGRVGGDTQVFLDWETEAHPYPVWTLEMRGDEIQTRGQAIVKVAEPSTDRKRYVIRWSGNSTNIYTIFGELYTNGKIFVPAEGVVNHNLYVGAYYDNGSPSRMVAENSKVYNLEVYSKALTDKQCKAYYETGVIS